jgi:hypothetical protein
VVAMESVRNGDVTGQVPPRVEPSNYSIGDVPIYIGPRMVTLGMKRYSSGKTNYYVRQSGTMRNRYIGRFPLTEDGWQAAWGGFASADPDGALRYWDRLRTPESPTRATSSVPEPSAKHEQHEQVPSGVLMLGALLGWGPWSSGIGVWEAYGDSGFTISGHNASTSAVHGLCQAGDAAYQPGFCGGVDAHYTFGVAMLVIGVLAFVGGMIGLFVAQQRNPKTWRQAGGPILAGLIFGLFAVVAVIIVAIVRGVQEGGTNPSTMQAQPVATASPQLPAQSSDPPMSARQMNVQWRPRAEGGWEWLASDGHWYPQQVAPAGLLPPAPPPPAPATRAT